MKMHWANILHLVQHVTVILPHPVLVAILFSTAFLLFAILRDSFSRKPRLPPSPFRLPIIGNLHQIGPLPHRSLHALSQKHGPLMLLQLGQVPTVVVSSPDTAREVMKTKDHIFSNRPSLRVPNRLLYGCRDIAFSPYGEHWRHARKFSVHHLLSPKRVQSYRAIREEEVAFMIEKVTELSSKKGPVNMSEIISSFAKDVTSRIAFGRCSRDEGWSKTIDAVIEESAALLGVFHVGDFFPWFAWLSWLTGLDARVEKTFKKVDGILEAILEGQVSRRSDGRNGSDSNEAFLDVLLSLGNDTLAEFHFDKQSIKAILEDLYGAGTDSTIIVLEWALAELLKNPRTMIKLKEEMGEIVGPGSVVKEAHLSEMNYLKSVMKETMRLHPPGPLLVPRELMENTQIQGYQIPKQARVLVNAWAIGRDPIFWDAPEEFRPERFMSSSIDFKGHDFQLIPFGAGRRVCPGIQFAASVIELALANLIHRFDWRLPDGMTREELSMAEAPGITTRKKIMLHIVATPNTH